MNIFDAIAYSISKVTPPKKGVSSPPSSDSPPVELEESILADEGDADLFEDNPEEDKQDREYSGDTQLSGEFSTSFLDLDKNTDSTPDPYSTSFREMEPRTIEDETNTEPVDESWAEDILEDVKPLKSEKADTSLAPTTRPNTHTNPQKDTTTEDSPPPPKVEKEDYHKLSFDYHLDADPSDKKWISTTIFSILNTILLTTLIAQAGWFHYEKLAKYPIAKQLFSAACSKLKCTLPKLENINKIKSQNLVVRSHPTTAQALIIDTVIINDAKFDQKFPNIALYFSDINKQVVAQRLIQPHEYLSGDLTEWPTMPSKQPIHVSLEIIDPGSNAVNYSIRFYLQKIDNLDS